jgi:SAM-dependent methyltransferase
MKLTELQAKNIEDFGEQWVNYRDSEGYFGSAELFADILGPLLAVDEIKGRRVADIGSGAGRIVNMLLACGVESIIAVEPSDGFEVMRQNIAEPAKVTCIRAMGDQLPADSQLDYVFCIGVLHQVPEPELVARAALRALKPGGRFVFWLYAKEGNGLYLVFLNSVHWITRRLPHRWLHGLVRLLDIPLVAYMWLCRWLPLPLHTYIREQLSKFTPASRRLVIYDQLNPNFVKYYTRADVEALMAAGGFSDVQCYHRHGYSWTAIGTRAG